VNVAELEGGAEVFERHACKISPGPVLKKMVLADETPELGMGYLQVMKRLTAVE